MSIIIGNIIGLIAAIIMMLSGLIKSKKKILIWQTTQIGITVISNIILGGITGIIVNLLSVIRNILCYKDKLNITAKIIISSLATIISIRFNNLGIAGYLPVISTVTYIWLMDVKDVKKFKLLICFTMVMWLGYDLAIKGYTMALFDFLTIVSNVSTIIYKVYKEKSNLTISK